MIIYVVPDNRSNIVISYPFSKFFFISEFYIPLHTVISKVAK